MKAAASQGRGEFEEVIALSKVALSHHPSCEMAFGLMADDLIRLGRTEEANEVLSKAVELHPKNASFNISYAQLLHKSGSPIEAILPYAQAFLDFQKSSNSKWPFYMKPITRLLGLGGRAQDTIRHIDKKQEKDIRWASYICSEIESKTNPSLHTDG